MAIVMMTMMVIMMMIMMMITDALSIFIPVSVI
jgi:hypothetical protein